MSLVDAFNSLLSLQSKSMVLKRLDGAHVVNLPIAPSNYSRSLAGPASTSVQGFEFVISKKALGQTTFPGAPKKKDRIIDTELGDMAIEEVVPMFDFGGTVIGWRVRTG